MSRWPIRWRLTTWYALAMTVILAAVGGVLYAGLQRDLDDELDERLAARVVALSESARSSAGRPALDSAVVTSGDDDELIRLWTVDGTMLVDTWRSSESGLTSEEVAARAASSGVAEPTVIDSIDVNGESYRRAIATLTDGAAPYGVLQVGHSRQDVQDTLRALRVLFLVVAPIAIALALGGGFVLAGRALAPVNAITSLARRISGADLTERLALELPDDELGRLAGTFDEMLDRVEDAFERQRRFTGDAAHELRTPLSLIRTRVDLALARDRPGAEYRETLVELDRDVVRLSGLVGTLLMIARADAGTFTLDRQPTDLRDTVQSVVDQYREAVMGPTFGFTPAPEPVMATVDEDQLVQLLVNLIDNAVAHTPPDGAVDVGCEVSGAVASIWVSDTGMGIGAEHLDRVFDRFYRVDAGRTASAGGAGLGLSICKTIVEAHGGTVRITSELGVGTRVEATFPIGP